MVTGAAIDDQRQWLKEQKQVDEMHAAVAQVMRQQALPPLQGHEYNLTEDPNDFEEIIPSSSRQSQPVTGYDEEDSDNDIGLVHDE
jgi:hypothetical protein